MNAHGDGVGALAMDHIGYVEAEALKHAGDFVVAGNQLAVDPDIGAVVDAVKMEPDDLAFEIGGQGELGAEPVGLGPGVFLVGKMAVFVEVIAKVLLRAGVGNPHVVEADIRIGIDALTNECGLGGGGHGGCVPTLGAVEAGLGERGAMIAADGFFAHLPVFVKHQGFVWRASERGFFNGWKAGRGRLRLGLRGLCNEG